MADETQPGNPFQGAKVEDIKIISRGFYADTVDTGTVPQPMETPASETQTETPGGKAPVAEPAAAASEASAKPAEPVTAPEPKAKAVEEKPAPVVQAPAPESVAQTVTDWKEVLKNVDLKELLKEKGVPEFAIGAVDYYQRTGDLAPYVEAKSVDWAKVPAEDILKRNLRDQYPLLSEDQFKRLCELKITRQYGLNDDDETVVSDGKLLMEVDSKAIRDKYTEQQKNFKAPERQLSKEETDVIAQQEQMDRELQEFTQSVKADPFLQSLLQSGELVIGEGDDAFKFKVKAQDVVDRAINNQQFFSKFWTQKDANSKPVFNTKLWAKVNALVEDDAAFEKTMIDHGKTLGRKEEFEKDANIKKTTDGPAPPVQETFWQALAARGKHNNGS